MVLDKLKNLLGLDDNPSGAAALKAALREPPTDVELHGIFEQPYLDPTGANTAVFPVQVYDERSGADYATEKIEFRIETDEGKSALDAFLRQHGIEDRENLDEIENKDVPVNLREDGNITVEWGDA